MVLVLVLDFEGGLEQRSLHVFYEDDDDDDGNKSW